jgi:hypothetical protein
MSEPPTWTHIHFDLNKVDIDYLRELRSNLMDEGAYFDYGVQIMPKENRTMEWQTDWSLTGHMDVADICFYLDARSVEYTLVKVINHEEE